MNDHAGAGNRRAIALTLAAAALSLAWLAWDAGGYRRTLLVGTGVLVLFAAGALRVSRWAEPHSLVTLALLAGLTAIGVVTGLWLPGRQMTAYAVAAGLIPVAVGWAIVLSVHDAPRQEAAPPPWEPSRTQLLMAALLAGAVLAALHWIRRAHSAYGLDETLYLLQGELFRRPGFGAAVDSASVPHFAIQQTYVRDGLLYTQYPPGWPAILAVFSLARLQWWANVSMIMVAATGVYQLGRRLHSAAAGAFAALAFLLSPAVIRVATNYGSHPSSMAALVTAAWLLLRGADRTESRTSSWVLAGLALGIAVSVRPLTGVLTGAALAGWLLMCRPSVLRSALRFGGCVALGAAGPIVATLGYNAITTGNPTVFGYTMANGALHDLGFGPRGFVSYSTTGAAYTTVNEFTPAEGAARFLRRLAWLAGGVAPAWTFIPVLGLASAMGHRVRWRMGLPFLLLPLGYAFYFWPDERLVIELIPFASVGFGVALAAVATASPVTARRLVAVLGIAAVAGGALVMADRHRRESWAAPWYTTVEALRTRHGRVLLLVHDGEAAPQLFAGLFRMNARGALRGDVVVARSLGDGPDRALAARYRDHTAFSVTWSGPDFADGAFVPFVR